MRSFAIAAFAALTAAATATDAGDGQHAHFNLKPKPFGNKTHFYDHRAGRIVQHYTNWSNGTYFRDPATDQKIRHFDCDVQHSSASDHYHQTVQRLHAAHLKGAIGSRAPAEIVGRAKQQVSTPIKNVPLYIHVITKQSNQGLITQDMVKAQAKVLNDAYSPYGITFTLAGSEFTANDAWATAKGSDMDALKKALRKGSYSALNLYFHTDLDGGVLGTCTLPSTVPKGSGKDQYYNDGCNIAATTMPGSTMLGYNQGKTAVHETGHWLGLLHTFEGYSCSGNGDFIGDTAFESQSTNGCPTSPAKNSCPGVSKGDPIHNYMDYSTDACYSKFTAGQVKRISSMWTQYRKGQ
ncbi:hypothetical protein LTR53_006963 [Teratosphaeriaceae sp. CCFEE 6253]|nr:hypothetical protein LTR53_006963 [Teratosphaeriaceae sp. CCFEE 6253]